MVIDDTLLNDLAVAIESGESVWEVVIPNDTFKGVFKGLLFCIMQIKLTFKDIDQIDIIAIKDNCPVDSLKVNPSDYKRALVERIFNLVNRQVYDDNLNK